MEAFEKRLSEILGRLQSPRAKIVFLDQLLKKTKNEMQISIIEKFLAQAEKEEDNIKKESLEKAKKASSEFEKILLNQISENQMKPTNPIEDPKEKIEPIERQLDFVEKPSEIKKSDFEDEIGYLENPAERSTYVPQASEKKATGRSYVAHSSTISNINSTETEKNDFSIKEYKEKENLEGYVPTGEIHSESIKKEKEAYKRKKIL